ncbi:MAG: acyl-CoA desaturase [Deltaproteobacteria bacterium]|nr:acyl-CoA desaturase [Deltaproteobacteria bacterium]
MASSTDAVPEWIEKKKLDWGGAIPFILCHLVAFGAIWTGITWQAAVVCLVLYVVRMWGVTAGYHRYFSHRTFKTSRVFQFILAFIAMSSAQKGVLWWGAHHRRHHKHSDQPGDIHSPVLGGFWHSHMGWLFYDGASDTDMDKIKDFAKYPELVWLNKYFLVPPTVLAVACLTFFGLPGLIVGFFWSTVLLWHGTFFINSLAHVFGKRRFQTTDDSRNGVFLALITLGEGWHNNHHRYQASARNGFYWWELDVTYYVLKALSWLGIVWDLRPVPEKILEEGREADRARAAGELADEPVAAE